MCSKEETENHIQEDVTDPKEVKKEPESTGLPYYTYQDISELQQQDADLMHLHNWMDQRVTPKMGDVASLSPAVRKYWINAENLVRRNGVIYFKNWTCLQRKDFKLQMLIPKCLKSKIIRDHHDTLSGDHFGIKKTSRKIREKFHWYMMDFDIKLHIRRCKKCNQNKSTQKTSETKLRQYEVEHTLNPIGTDIMEV